jgi:alpha-tubulin suppressor-like RCC1 family protein
VAVSYFHTCAVAGTTTGSPSAYCWGNGNDGRLGNGSLTSSLIPVSAGLDTESVSAITTGRYHSCAIASGGAVCWGNNGTDGALGNGSTAQATRPVGVKNLGNNSGFPADIQVSMTNGTDSDTTQVKLELR